MRPTIEHGNRLAELALASDDRAGVRLAADLWYNLVTRAELSDYSTRRSGVTDPDVAAYCDELAQA